MDVKIVSEDVDLCRMCREILSGIVGHSFTLSAVRSEVAGEDADLYVWDLQLNDALPDVHFNLSKHLFLVHRRDVPRFREQSGASEAHILLKPVTRATLAAFLGLAVSAYEDRTSAANSLQADRDEILQCLIQTNLKLQEHDHDRTSFLARALHDFRAPLTALNGYCGLLLTEPLGPLTAAQRDVIQRMQQSAKRLARMSAAAFDLSVERQMKRKPELRRGEIGESVDQAMHEVSPLADEKRITLTADVVPSERPLFYEPSQIERMLINILDNACKFTPKGGAITVRGYPFFWDRRAGRQANAGPERRQRGLFEPNAYRVDIHDNGPQIPPEHLKGIFEEYTSYRGVRDRSGGGLGLAICRMIASQHDGHVWAENTDSGPMFCFVLPLSRPEVSRAPEAGVNWQHAEI